MHTLHDYIAKQLADKFKSRGVVVWYDERSEFQPLVDELRCGPRTGSEPRPVSVAGANAVLAEYAGSMFELRAVVEPHVSGDTPGAVVIYVPGIARDRRASVLMELEKAGTTWEPQLKQLAKNVLLQKYTLGVVDEMLPFDRKVSYEDLARAAAGNAGAEPPSILKGIFHDASGNDGLLTAWLVNDSRDAEIVNKEATGELIKLIQARLGLSLKPEDAITKLRALTLRYVLAGEFRLDLSCDPPASLAAVPTPSTKDESAVRTLARLLRSPSHAKAYEAIADRIEDELSLSTAKIPADKLGTIDTFRFEEQSLLRHAGDLIAAGRFDAALQIVTAREQSFWLDRSPERKARWEASRLMAQLGNLAVQIRVAASKMAAVPANWVTAYTEKGGWHRLDQAQRRLESLVANLEDEPDEQALGVVRRLYDETCHAMAVGFTAALGATGWNIPKILHQNHVFSDVLSERPKPVAYFLVDAMRFEMGIELAERMNGSEVAIQPAIGSLPSITPVGMAALMPLASSSFSIDEDGGKLGARIDGAFMADLTARKKFIAARVPKLVDLTSDELLSLPPNKLRKKIEGATIVLVRSQEIDHAGEAGFTFQARQIMDTVIDNLARAIRKLAAAGIEHAVVSADHGHLCFPVDRDESMRIDAPGGQTVDLHRRCWIGRGGKTPPGCVRVQASALGYSSDLEFVFPSGTGVFRAGGDLAFHHGGPSLQELIIPVITIVTRARRATPVPQEAPLRVAGAPTTITNRMVTFEMSTLLGSSVIPVLLRDGRKVGGLFGTYGAGSADRVTGVVTIPPGATTTVAMLLLDDTAPEVTLVLQDPATDLELYRSPAPIPVRLGV